MEGEVCGACEKIPGDSAQISCLGRAKLREQAIAVESERLSKVETLKTNPLEFFRQVQEHMLITTSALETL